MRLAGMGAVAAACVIGLSACGGTDEGGTTAGQAAPQRQAPAPMETASADEATPEFRYDPTGKPDPFRSFLRELARIKTVETATPLERFDLSQLAVRAVIWGSHEPRALINDPSGKGYIVSKGTPVGKNDGRIVDISDGRIVVKETYVDFEGQATTKDVELHMAGR